MIDPPGGIWICKDPLHYPLAQAFAQQRVGYRNPFVPGSFVAISLMDGWRFRATVIFNQYNGVNIEMHVASDGSRRWLRRDYLYACFAFPFVQLGCKRVTGCVAANNKDALRFDAALGFKQEGLLRQAYETGDDLIILGMLREECRFLKAPDHEQT